MIAWLITSRLGRAIALAGAVLLALVTFGASERRKGRKQAANEAKEADNERADKIRDNVERNIDDRVSDHDGAGYRK